MKTLKLCSLLAAAMLTPVFGAGGWHTDYDAAKKLAAKQDKDLLIDFTGSDWCGWCIKLKKEVFDQDAFKKGVADHFVLVELDYPRDKSKLSKEIQAQNEKLKKQFAVRGFPSIYLCDAKGRPYARTGYQAGGGKKYVAHLNELRAKREARDEAFAALKGTKGEKRAAGLEKALAMVPAGSLDTFYKREFNDLAKLNPKAPLVQKTRAAAAEAKLQGEFRSLFEKDDFDGVIRKVDQSIAKNKPEGEALQKILVYKLNALMGKKDFRGAEAMSTKIEKVDPKSRYGRGMEGFRKHLAEKKKAEKAQAKAAPVKGKQKQPAKASVPAKKLATADKKKREAGKAKAPGKAKVARESAKPMAKKEAKPAKQCPTKAKNTAKPKQSESQLKKAHDQARMELAQLKALHTESQKGWDRVQASLKDQRGKVSAMERELAKLRKGLAETEKKAVAIKKKHEELHRGEAKAEQVLQGVQKEMKRRAAIAKLEAEASALQRKAEELRKQAEKLKN